MLLDEAIFDGKTLGLISQEGINFGGEDPTLTPVYAAQRRSAPVVEVMTSPGSTELTCNLIELRAQHLVDVLGGSMTGEKWDAPATPQTKTGKLVLKTGRGQTLTYESVSLSGKIAGALGGTGTLYAALKMKMQAPADGSSPYRIEPTTPDVAADTDKVLLPKEGGTRVVRISASDTLTISGTHTGFTIAQDGNSLVISAPANSGSTKKTGTVTLTLTGHPTKKVTITLEQAG